MKHTDLDYFKRWFKEYVGLFHELPDDGIQPILLKEQHTERICKEILLLARDLGLSEEDLLLAETAALFHDIGRFPQWKYYSTFIDSESKDHALLGLEVLFEHGVLLRISSNERELIHQAVCHHNLRKLPGNLSPRQLLFSRLLRDADKLDIWQLIIMQQRERSQLLENLAGNMPASATYSREILETLRQGKTPDFSSVRNKNDMSSSVRNKNDMRLVRLGWVFDLNFAVSCRQVLERGYIGEISSQLPANEEIKELKEYLISYLKNRGSSGNVI
jgi:putative nucleotidyltransferase with HDIG domain